MRTSLRKFSLLLNLTSIALSGCMGAANDDKVVPLQDYLLTEASVPPGVRYQSMTQDDKDDLGIATNPGKSSPEEVRAWLGLAPAEVWFGVLDGQTNSYITAAFRFSGFTDYMNSQAPLSEHCRSGQGYVLGKEPVLVLVMVEDEGSSARELPRIAGAIADQHEMHYVCRPS